MKVAMKAAEVGCSVQVIKDVVSDNPEDLPENLIPAANHLTDFQVPISGVDHYPFPEISTHRHCIKLYFRLY